MSLLATYFVATSAEARTVGFGASSPDGVDGPAFLPDQLEDIARRMNVEHGVELVPGGSEECWVLQFTTPMATALANTSPEIGDDEADAFNLSAEEIELVELLQPLARQAIDRPENGLYAWIAL